MQPENRHYLLVKGSHLTCPHDLRQGPLGTRVPREPNKELTVHPLYNITLLFPTQTCQFQMGLLQRAQQNVLGLQIQMRDVSFMQELQGTSWGASPRKISQRLVPTLPQASIYPLPGALLWFCPGWSAGYKEAPDSCHF